jgi:hypothetical protein
MHACIHTHIHIKTTQIWVGEDVGCGLQKAGKKDTFVASPLWGHILSIIKANVKGKLSCNYSNYSVTTDTLGLGLGSVSEAETWEVWALCMCVYICV